MRSIAELGLVAAAAAFVLTACGSDDPSKSGAGGSSAGSNAAAGSDSAPGGGGVGTAGAEERAGSAGVGTGGAGGAGKGGSAGATASGGAPMIGAWKNATGNLANMTSECGNLGLVSAQPGTDLVIAGIAQKGLWGTHDGGATWTQLGTGAGSATITNRISAIVWDPDDASTFWESGIYNGGGVYKTTDNGETFKQMGNVAHNDSVSVDLTDDARKTLLAGSHETAQKLFLSIDAGATWNDIGAQLPAEAGACTSALVLDAQHFLVGCSGSGNGIYRSVNAGGSWARVGTAGVWAQPLVASDGSIYWVGNQGGVQKSNPAGDAFTAVADGNIAATVIAPTTMAELPDGRLVVVGKDHLQVSSDNGGSWAALGDPLPIPGGGYNGASGVTYSAATKTLFVWHWDCSNNVAADAIMSLTID